MKHYNYTKELETVLGQLKEVQHTKKHEKLYANAPEDHKPILRKAYKDALKVALFNLSIALDTWVIEGCQIEEGDKRCEL